jgi:retinol-binding protein 3
MMNLPFAQSVNPYWKTNPEDTGVRPDIPAKADRALYKAQELILLQALAKAKTDRDRRKLQWALDELMACQQEYAVTVADLVSYTGNYNGLFFIFSRVSYFARTPGGAIKSPPSSASWQIGLP